ncbi:MAG: trypsin-like peptidase domain-containing protein [Eubacteriales bacterium]|nr:trypsin-like peptidase domain-containing protein [bacterium]MDY2791454.1 trypsin-like peptidase domain-containing protein [Eubacteriales bacterium]
MKQQKTRLFTLLAALIVCLAGILSTAAQAQSYDVIYGQQNPIPDIAERVRPAVVRVISSRETWSRQQGRRVEESGYGSGVYIDGEGYVVTNYHVVSDADVVEIETLAGDRLTVQQVFSDDSTDLALLRLEAPLDLEPVPLGDSDALRIGELAVVIGHPGMADRVFFGTVTAGIVSGLDRRDVNAGNFGRTVNTIQVDAAINPGNSGGALLNANGELVGIPTLKAGSEYGENYEGLGFCIPVNTVREVVAQLKEYGVVRRPRMGIRISELDGPDELIPGYPPAGLLVIEIEEGTPAAQSGLALYDVITHANGTRVKQFTDLSDLTDTMSAGDVLHLTVCRCYDPAAQTLLDDPQTLEFDIELKVLD